MSPQTSPEPFLFTSESVTEGHPDKIADQISDAILDAALAADPASRVAAETLVTTGLILVAGEITTSTYIDIPRLARQTVREIGYDSSVKGFDADTGLTGRKIIVDTYGGSGHHGGGAFSGKDPSKVDRSAAYAARHIAKNLVAAGVADQVEIQLAYAIGVAEPVSISVNTFGTGQVSDAAIVRAVREVFTLTPRAIIERLDLRRPIYQATAAYGHFGRPEFSWERTDQIAALQAALR
jgi:S-adenosylmethionine synthetase